MTQETITVAYCNPPAEGKKQATIKTNTGAIYGLAPERLSYFKVGATYTVEVASREFQGRTFKTIKSIVSGNGAAPAAGRPPQSTAEEMFVMGFLNRCYEGTGSVPDRLTLTMAVRNLRGAWKDGFAADVTQKAADPQAPVDEEIPGDWA